jgi:hypothetical protein
VKKVRPKAKAAAFLRLDTLPGEQAQIDWPHVGEMAVPGGKSKLWVFPNGPTVPFGATPPRRRAAAPPRLESAAPHSPFTRPSGGADHEPSCDRSTRARTSSLSGACCSSA